MFAAAKRHLGNGHFLPSLFQRILTDLTSMKRKACYSSRDKSPPLRINLSRPHYFFEIKLIFTIVMSVIHNLLSILVTYNLYMFKKKVNLWVL